MHLSVSKFYPVRRYSCKWLNSSYSERVAVLFVECFAWVAVAGALPTCIFTISVALGMKCKCRRIADESETYCRMISCKGHPLIVAFICQ